MASLLDSVDLRTQLAGQNRLELLLFRLRGRQRFGINVFKVREVIQCPSLTKIPKADSMVRGVAHLRGQTVSVVDLGMALGQSHIEDPRESFMIMSEYNRSVQGFLVNSVDRIVNMKWESIMPPPPGVANTSYLTAVTEVDGELVQVIDVEKVLAEMGGLNVEVSSDITGDLPTEIGRQHVLVVDDSHVARKQITRTLEQLGLTFSTANNGREGLNLLQHWADNQDKALDNLLMIITDIEMPEMDGYTLTSEVKKDPRFENLHVVLHSSLSGVFNKALAEKVGADRFLAKFKADELAAAVAARMSDAAQERAAAA